MLVTVNQNEVLMTTVEFLEKIVNPARIQAGEKEVRYNDFLARAKDEVDISHDEIFAMESTGGRSRQVFNLDYDSMMLIGMRESKAVRKSVLAKIKELASPAMSLPDFSNPAEAALK